LELEAVKKIYAAYSYVYDVIFKRFFFPRIEYAIKSMDISPGDRVLDVGVGTGLSLSLFPRHCEVVGIDLSGEMLKKARKKVKTNGMDNVELIEMDAMNVDFKDDSFDKVFISHVVSVVPDPYRVMGEVRRVCKNGGQVVVVNHFKSRNKLMGGLERMFNPISKRIGWRSDLSIDEFIGKSGLHVYKRDRLRRLDLWEIVFARNEK
jgi:phosphatidylethanolamine/phosphatidyl-N-methylethanolamine N-methyltransferase